MDCWQKECCDDATTHAILKKIDNYRNQLSPYEPLDTILITESLKALAGMYYEPLTNARFSVISNSASSQRAELLEVHAKIEEYLTTNKKRLRDLNVSHLEKYLELNLEIITKRILVVVAKILQFSRLLRSGNSKMKTLWARVAEQMAINELSPGQIQLILDEDFPIKFLGIIGAKQNKIMNINNRTNLTNNNTNNNLTNNNNNEELININATNNNVTNNNDNVANNNNDGINNNDNNNNNNNNNYKPTKIIVSFRYWAFYKKLVYRIELPSCHQFSPFNDSH